MNNSANERGNGTCNLYHKLRALELLSTEGVNDSSKNSMEFEQTELNAIGERDCETWQQKLKM